MSSLLDVVRLFLLFPDGKRDRMVVPVLQFVGFLLLVRWTHSPHPVLSNVFAVSVVHREEVLVRYHLLLTVDDDLLLLTGARLLHFAPILTELMVVSVFALIFFVESAQRVARARGAKGLTLLAAGFATGFAAAFGVAATTGARIFDRRAEISRSLTDTSSFFLAEAVRPAL